MLAIPASLLFSPLGAERHPLHVADCPPSGSNLSGRAAIIYSMTDKIKRGSVNPETGLVFAGYYPQLKDGQYWVTADQYDRMKEARKLDIRERRKLRSTQIRESAYYRLPHVKARYAAIRKTDKKRAYNREWAKRSYATNPLAKLKARCRQRIGAIIRSERIIKTRSTVDTIGCTWEFLKSYLEARFPPGMTWLNTDLWEIDHHLPLASATTKGQILKLCHYSNLVPLWKPDNRAKRAKMERQDMLAI